jgi:hypothetical protein
MNVTYKSDHIYITWGGTAPSGANFTGPEIWQTGAHYAPRDDGIPFSMAQIFAGFSLNDIAADVKAWFTDPNMHFSSDVRLDWVKAAWIKTDGEYATDARVVSVVWPSGGGGGGSLLQPLQSSMVVSLASGSTLGRANHGRLYLPTMSLGRQQNSAAVPDAARNEIGIRTGTLLKDIEGEVSQIEKAFELSILSKVGVGTTKKVTEIKVGGVQDTQRRRRNRADEIYSSVSYP